MPLAGSVHTWVGATYGRDICCKLWDLLTHKLRTRYIWGNKYCYEIVRSTEQYKSGPFTKFRILKPGFGLFHKDDSWFLRRFESLPNSNSRDWNLFIIFQNKPFHFHCGLLHILYHIKTSLQMFFMLVIAKFELFYFIFNF